MALELNLQQVEPDVTILQLKGRLTLGSDSRGVEMLVDQLRSSRLSKLVFDMTGVSYIDSAGIGVLTYSFSAMKTTGGELRLAGVSGRVMNLLKHTQLDQLLPVYSSVEEATRA
jgi:anti-sigma B factor antagonist